jgi:DNA-binding NarL/FixJ family response regulator
MQVNQSYISKIKNGTIWKSVSKEYYFPRDNDTRALIGEENPMAKVSVKEVKKICKLLEKGKTAKEISKKLGISMTIIYSIKQRKTWVSISKEYKF